MNEGVAHPASDGLILFECRHRDNREADLLHLEHTTLCTEHPAFEVFAFGFRRHLVSEIGVAATVVVLEALVVTVDITIVRK